jgi:hypothetical protein
MSSIITVNGKTYHGNHITMRDGKVIIDGKEQDQEVSGIVEIRVKGGLASLDCDASVTCEDVKGDVKSGGSLRCGNVGGNASAGGSLRCGKVKGNVSAGGSVRHG